MRQLTAIIGGSIGSNPYAPTTWSGSGPALFHAMKDYGLLQKAVGIELSRPAKAFLLAKNFTRNRTVWRKHFYFDPAYRNALTQAAKSIPVETPVLFQIGSMYSLPDVFPNHQCISYHDGNLPELIKSGFGMEGISAKRIDQALRYEEETSQKMTAIFTFSEYLRQSFIHDYHVAPERVFNVGGAINLTTIPPVVPDKSYATPSILFIGTEFTRKGGPQLLEAFKIVRQSIPTAELHIVGPHHLDNLPPGVIFHGHLSKADPAQAAKLESLFREATLFALPSLYEPFGIAPLEAMLYQLPALVTDDWALRESVTPNVNGDLAQKGNVEDIAAKLLQLLSHPDRLAEMGHRAREIVLAKYTWPTVVVRMSTVIERL
jgi:alpha-maltose-1-phosphate synthase